LSISYETELGTGQIFLSAEAGITAIYGVNKEVESEPDYYLEKSGTSEEETELVADLVTFDENGKQTSKTSIATAIANTPESSEKVEAETTSNLYSAIARVGLPLSQLAIVLDPGHDDSHAGASATFNGIKYREEERVLKIAQYCKQELEKYQGIVVYMTRTTGACPFGGKSVTSGTCNTQRVNYAKSVGANVYVSFHLNASSTTSTVSGAGVYVPNNNYRKDIAAEGKVLGTEIFKKLQELGLKSWGGGVITKNADSTTYPDKSKADYLAVIRQSKEKGITAVLIEHAFISTPGDILVYLGTEDSLQRLGVADAQGIANAYGLWLKPGFGLVNPVPDAVIPETALYGGTDYASVFDYAYYASRYEDVRNTVAATLDYNYALMHFAEVGMREGRQGSPAFDLVSYAYEYSDLRAAYKNDFAAYYRHYLEQGRFQNRKASGTTTVKGYTTQYNNKEYKDVYDYNFYTSLYPTIKQTFGFDDAATLKYFVKTGMKSGQQGNKAFDVQSYAYANPSVRKKYKNKLASYYTHYISTGKKKKLRASGVTKMSGFATVYKGTNYKHVYDYNYYVKAYPNVKKKYGFDDATALKHFVGTGMKKAYRAKSSFNVLAYRKRYKNLRKLYKKSYKSYYLHYIKKGKKQGLKAV
jgi:N-acetylmuramoyl-L-alanine amidase